MDTKHQCDFIQFPGALRDLSGHFEAPIFLIQLQKTSSSLSAPERFAKNCQQLLYIGRIVKEYGGLFFEHLDNVGQALVAVSHGVQAL